MKSVERVSRSPASESEFIMASFRGVLRGATRRQHFGDEKAAALKSGIELGMNLTDTAEAYQTEKLVREFIRNERRYEMFIATKVCSSSRMA
jgi:diketogulonate reductase-like aldo/keto reductase